MRHLMPLLLLTACAEPADEPELPLDLAAALEVDRLVAHLDALEAIADAAGGNRLYASRGYADSLDYVQTALEEAGLAVTVDPFELASFTLNDASLHAIDGEFATPVAFEVFTFSGTGDVTAEVVAVDVTIPPGATNSSTSGCEAADFQGFPAGAIALIQRGTCRFSDKVANATEAGAAAVIVFNEGQNGRRDVVEGALDDGALAPIPAVGVAYATGEALAQGGTARVFVDASIEIVEDYNLIAEIPGEDPARVVLVGAHLDSVEAGPGINDNGSGSALILELALRAAEAGWRPRNTVRFAWWGAEEQGLLGSAAYFFDALGEPDEAALDGVEAHLNFDMVASGNGGRWVYDGDESDISDNLATPGSAEIEALFLDWFAAEGLATAPEGLLVPTDSYWTVWMGLPTGGLFSGAMAIKTAAQEDLFGGEAGEPHDACYHRACDRVANIDPVLYGELAAAAAHVVQALGEREAPMPGRARRATPDLPRPRGCHDEVRWDR